MLIDKVKLIKINNESFLLKQLWHLHLQNMIWCSSTLTQTISQKV